jgi:hypothetical protein
MTARPWLGLIVIALALSGCQIGPSVGGFHPATGPAGITVHVVTQQKSKYDGELLEARDTALLVLAYHKVQLVPFAVIRTAGFEQRSSLDFGGGSAPSGRWLSQIRQLARFPAGLTPELLQRLLQANAQAAPEVVR